MIKKHQIRLKGFYVLSDVVGIIISFFYSYLFRFYGYIIPVVPERGIPPIKSYVFVFPLFLFAHMGIFYFQGFYKSPLKRTRLDNFFLICLNAVLTIAFVQIVLNYLYTYSQGPAPLFQVDFKLSHGFLAIYFLAFIFMISFLRNQIYYYMKRRYARGLNLKNVLIVGAGEMGKTVAQKLGQYRDLGFYVKGFLDDEKKVGETIPIDDGIKVLGTVDQLGGILETHEISEVYVAMDLSNYEQILKTLKIVNKYVVNVRLVPDLFQLLTLKARLEDLDGFPVISIDEPPMKGVMLVMKKIFDRIVSAVLLLLLLPLLLIVALLIKITSRGPIFYHQERMGLDGKRFNIHKFRTMVVDAEKSGPQMCRQNDDRVTKVGRILRKYSIDELPQFFNVLKGEMSLVGPRPERPVFVYDFRERYPKYMLRHKVKSGITGWAQVHGLRQDTPIEERLDYDFYYIQNWSFALDLKILWMTIRRGFIDKNA